MIAETTRPKSIFFLDFFKSNEYFIDEKIGFFKFHNEYKVYDNTATPVRSTKIQNAKTPVPDIRSNRCADWRNKW